MSKKLLIGVTSGLLIGLAIPVIIKLRKENELSEGGEHSGILDKANSSLLKAKMKADKILADAEKKSKSIIGEAGDILSEVKEKTSSLHFEHKEAAIEEINRIKEEIESSIKEFQKKIKN